MSTTIQDVIATHDAGITFGQYIGKVANDSQSPRVSLGQVSAWDALKSFVSDHSTSCGVDAQIQY